MLEFEKKIMLTEQEYNLLTTYKVKNTQSRIQTNYYFDTDDFDMNKKDITCRVRSENGKFKSIIKSHVGVNSDCSIESDVAFKDEFDPSAFSNMGLHMQGALITERMVLYKNECCEMVLDRNIYLGMSDFELEVEYTENSEDMALQLINVVAKGLVDADLISSKEELLMRIGKSKSKSQRFFAQKQKTNKN